MKRLVEWGLAFSILSLSFSISFLVWQNPFTHAETFNPYRSISLYGSELLIWMTFLLWLIDLRFQNKLTRVRFTLNELCALGLLGMVGINSLLVSLNALTSLAGLVHFLTALIFVKLLSARILPQKVARKIFYSTLVVQGVLAMAQVGLNHSLGLNFLGEPWLTNTLPGVAKIHLGQSTLLRGYGTFPHPNILAGYILIGFLMLMEDSTSFKKRFLRKTIQLVFALGGLFTLSKGAFMAFLTSMVVVRKIKPILASVLLVLFLGVGMLSWGHLSKYEFVHERILYTHISLTMLWEHPEGVGINQFTERMQEFTATKLQPWQFQPVHNIFLLIANEWGILPLIFIMLGGGLLLNNKKWQPCSMTLMSALLTLGLFDHYLFSSYQGLLLTAFVFAQSEAK
ncbi:MAG: hypothetical protein ACD_28C00077G0006 [uncultured bacterium]|nr:MAG: hypothetical protein ACD_28C00077G0006 [uncultured bacterium]KKT75845.1 MAG: hypothetical protein UW70_C0027G0031 [Candidatus Peregrinibacteria bacterium GW2011_GWA2_44_7]